MSELGQSAYLELVRTRVREPRALQRALSGRARRPIAGPDGRLMLLAADHTARGVLSAGGDKLAVADRFTLLDRLVRGLAVSGVDGVLGSADILEELAFLGALEGKLAIGTMNRGGVIGTKWELDDRLTAYDVSHIAAMGLDGGKTLLRIEDTDRGLPPTLELVARITTDLADLGLMSLIEPLPYQKNEQGDAFLDPAEEKLIKVVAIASGLGASSAFTWLKIPATEHPERVAAATSCPILLLGGDPGANWEQVFARWQAALVVPNVVGLVPGRTLLYPSVLSVEEATARAAHLVHGGPR